ncbi:MAG: rhomboid family intramembrane serine protease, partial [Candidatus Subteraquimicrobiales bacterium]|nr:rhomboid family intramembrane serine protease [Candidatus Subteraquimicrobiales bacterium]
MVIPLRDENPTKTVPFITLGLIAINVFVFVYELSLGLGSRGWEQFIYSFSMFPYRVVQGDLPAFVNIFTSMFLHGNWLHIIGNMLYLWIFGNNVEDYLGHMKFFGFYLLCGLGGTVGQILSNPMSTIPNLGASGAIAGILGAYLILYPGARILTLVPLFFFIEIVRL